MKNQEQKNYEHENKLLYSPPTVESEEIFEKHALACGKCQTGPHQQHACFRLPSVS